MPWRGKLMKNTLAKSLAQSAVLVALALALSWVERFIPLGLLIPLPGVKLGLANIVTLVALYMLPFRQTTLILLGRIVLGSVFAGLSGLLFSLFGGIAALLCMSLAKRTPFLSIYGVSILGAAAHNIGQIAAAVLVLGTVHVAVWLAPLLALSLLSGAITAITSSALLKALFKTQNGDLA